MTLPETSPELMAVLHLAQTCEYEANHTHQVTRLALRLFDELQSLHQLGKRQRELLHYASLLHDIGWIEGWREHHKVTLRVILTTQLLPFSNKERLVIGSVARYHRKALPDLKHDHYAALDPEERHMVDMLSAILRLADGLDRSHQSRVRDLSCKVSKRKITVRCLSPQEMSDDLLAGLQKGDLLVKTFNRKLVIEVKIVQF